jgi:8-oxo-dGTP pyrophosphatase MutT (NUDIX family)
LVAIPSSAVDHTLEPVAQIASDSLLDLEPIPFEEGLRATLQKNLQSHTRLEQPLEGRRHAAVAVVVINSDSAVPGHEPLPAREAERPAIPPSEGVGLDGGVAGAAGAAAVILTRRATAMRAHPGQWALPGGRLEPGESPLDAALRELHEELRLQLGPQALIGTLDDYPTRSGYVITPVVLWVGGQPDIRADPREVRSVHQVTFSELCRPDSPRFVSIPESDRPVVQIPIGSNLVHAPTGAVLLQFRRVAIEGISERVHHYEQPVFAWR